MAGMDTDAVRILNEGKKYADNMTIEISLGNSYMELHKYQDAEVAYLFASNMIPSRLYPKYLLAKLYEKTGQKQKCLLICDQILLTIPLIKSIAAKQIKLEISEIRTSLIESSNL
jgi:tetratricopeptide (TPR) repeat protein